MGRQGGPGNRGGTPVAGRRPAGLRRVYTVATCSRCDTTIVNAPVLRFNLVYCSWQCAAAASATSVIPGQYFG